MAKEKDPAAVALGRKGGQVTGVAKGFAGMDAEKLEKIRRKAAAGERPIRLLRRFRRGRRGKVHVSFGVSDPIDLRADDLLSAGQSLLAVAVLHSPRLRIGTRRGFCF